MKEENKIYDYIFKLRDKVENENHMECEVHYIKYSSKALVNNTICLIYNSNNGLKRVYIPLEDIEGILRSRLNLK